MRQSKFLAAPIVALLLAACGGGGSSYGTGPGGNNPGGGNNNNSPNTVTLTASAFSPSALTVTAGTTVTWKWDSCDDTGGYGYGTCVSHDILFDDGSNTTSGTQSSGTFSRTFPTAGTYKYHCTIHGPAMSGQVVVQ